MKIIKSKETLILTQSERAILLKAQSILEGIYDECDEDGDIEVFSDQAKNNIEDLLDCAEIEGGEPSEAITVTIVM